jgi:hypothetical protein
MRILALVALVALVGPAAADTGIPEMRLRVVPTQAAPEIEATIINGPLLPIDKIFLVDEHHTKIAATSLVPWKAMPEPVAIAIVIAGSEVMVGNTSIEPDDSPARYPGYLEGVRAGMTALDLAHATPPGSQGILITYEDAARIRVPMGPIARLDAGAIGSEKDYYKRLGTDLVGGVELAVAELAKVSVPRKVLIVIGDGNDTNNDNARTQLAELAARASNANIETYALIYKGALSNESDVITSMIQDAPAAPSADAVGPAMAAIGARIANRYLVRFPGEHLTWDGSPQYVTVDLGGKTLEPVALYGSVTPPASPPARYNPFLSWWFQLAMGLGAVGVIALILRWRARVRNA